MSDDLEDELMELQQILGLGKKEATDIISEITSKIYRYMLGHIWRSKLAL